LGRGIGRVIGKLCKEKSGVASLLKERKRDSLKIIQKEKKGPHGYEGEHKASIPTYRIGEEGRSLVRGEKKKKPSLTHDTI